MRRREEARFGHRRRLGFELLEERRMLSVTLDVISQPGIPSSTPAGSSGTNKDAMSADGRYVLFGGVAPNLAAAAAVPAGTYNVFRYDRVLGVSSPVIVAMDGTFGVNAVIERAFISDDGNTLLFSTKATNLHPLDQDGNSDVYALNMLTSQTQLISVNLTGDGTGNADAVASSVSGDGSRVAFTSSATNLSELDANSIVDLYVRDIAIATTRLASIDSTHQGAGNGKVRAAAISANGRVVVFESEASNLDLRDTDATLDIFAYDFDTGLTTLVSVGQRTAGYIPRPSHSPRVSADGAIVGFASESDVLHPFDTDTYDDVFARDLVNQVTHLVTVDVSGTSSANTQEFFEGISADGKTLIFSTWASNLHPLITTIAMNTFARNLDTGITKLASVNRTGTGGQNDEWVSGVLSSNGRFVLMTTTADNLTFDAPNSATFLHDLQTGTTRPVKMNPSGSASSGGRSIDATGRYIAVQSGASGIVDNDFNLMQDVFLVDMQSDEIQHISTADPLKPQSTANAASSVRYYDSAMSADGRYVVFTSKANNLLDDMIVNTDEWTANVYRYDRLLDRIELVSVNSAGNGVGNSSSDSPTISADGRMIAFSSRATNLASGSLSGYYSDVFVRDMETGITQLVSKNVGRIRSGSSYIPRISADGTVVTFETTSAAVHPLKTTSTQDIVALNLVTGFTHLVTQSASGQSGGNKNSYSTGISEDGNIVLFSSEASNLHLLDTDNVLDVYARNLATGTTELVSVNSLGSAKGNRFSQGRTISADGTRIAFSSSATNLDPIDSSDGVDMYLRDLVQDTTQLVSVDPISNVPIDIDQYDDYEFEMSSNGRSVLFGGKKLYVRNLDTGDVQLVNVNANGVTGNGWDFNPVMSEDGTVVAFVSNSSNLDPLDTDTNDTDYDVYVRNLNTQSTVLLSKNHLGTNASDALESPVVSISADGNFVVFAHDGNDLVPRDWNQESDVYVAEINWNALALPGDYNLDGAVDAADYSVWRDAVGRTGLAAFSGADGDGDGDVDQDDYGVWKVNFGRVMAGGGVAGMERVGEVTRESVESTIPPADPEAGYPAGAGGRVQVVGLRVGLGSQPPALPGVLWIDVPVTRGDAAKDAGRDVLRRQPRQHSAAVADRALVAWVAERSADRSGTTDAIDARCGWSGDEDGKDLAELLESLDAAELAGI